MSRRVCEQLKKTELLVEAAGVELVRRIENREVIDSLRNHKTLNTPNWANRCMCISRGFRLALLDADLFDHARISRQPFLLRIATAGPQLSSAPLATNLGS
jgi:hypothetical protein